MGEFLVAFAPVSGPTLMAAASAWLKGRAGCRPRLTVSDTEVEANSLIELYGLLNPTIAITKRLKKPTTDHA